MPHQVTKLGMQFLNVAISIATMRRDCLII
jgi:hypothetical protein